MRPNIEGVNANPEQQNLTQDGVSLVVSPRLASQQHAAVPLPASSDPCSSCRFSSHPPAQP
ncbi:hypothetical protein E2C01_091263 [Portunus trituberculatus]|uniref:Uncharacterized protein n=1 Tax=Portunus trituberculatus TaxID=210409 RepID=A0A5B7JSA8_PORTR|nr:hypothetical protein [Portunus trituberculatus]